VALNSTLQDDWSGGSFRGRRAPKNAFYDATNALLNDEALLFKRGGSAYESASDAGATLLGNAEANTVGGQRPLGWTAATFRTYSGAAWVTPHNGGTKFPEAVARGVGLNGMWAATSAGGDALLYGGSLKTAQYGTGTVAVTNGSSTVTGTGTSWTANVDAGMILVVSAQADFIGVVKTVVSNTSITLAEPWGGTTNASTNYTLNGVIVIGGTSGGQYGADPGGAQSLAPTCIAAVGTPPRLLMCKDDRVYFTGRGAPASIDRFVDYHSLPAGASAIGAEGLGDTGHIFTSVGLFTIANMSQSAVDDFGNLGHTLSQANEIIALGNAGIVKWSGALLVPAVDDVYLFGPNGPTPIAGAIKSLYLGYVDAGYQPGVASVYRSHLFLPIRNSTTWVDTLVCRLDRGFGWTRFSGHAGSLSYAQRIGSSAPQPKLTGINGQRLTALAGCFAPTSSNAQDADATNFDCTITTRDYPTQQAHGFVQRARLRYELTDDGSGATAAPTVALAYSSDADAGAFATLTDKGLQGGGTGGAVSAGDKYSWWTVGKRRERIRFKITQTGAAASFILRSLEMLTRQSGRQ
jgi:hypothetical protein